MRTIGLLKADELEPHQKALIEEKKRQLEAQTKSVSEEPGADVSASGQSDASSSEGAVPGAQQCPKCNALALILMDGCMTCVQCGHSKCG